MFDIHPLRSAATLEYPPPVHRAVQSRVEARTLADALDLDEKTVKSYVSLLEAVPTNAAGLRSSSSRGARREAHAPLLLVQCLVNGFTACDLFDDAVC